MKKQDRLLMIGLNEFNTDLLKQLAGVFDLKGFQGLLKYRETKSTTDDLYESDYLEPWVQWVSVQTGTPSSTHRIKHLGDIPRVNAPQLWETLSKKGVTSGVWGAMNASRGEAKDCLFFVPDPWTFSETGYPAELGALLGLPRYLAKNYLNVSTSEVVTRAFQFFGTFAKSKAGLNLLKELPRFVRDLVEFRGEHFVYITFTEYLMASLFVEYRNKYQTQFSFIFVNSLAHLQHHHWNLPLETNKALRAGLYYLDLALKTLLNSLDEKEGLICLNALSQRNTNNENPWILYRQKDQKEFLRTLGLKPTRVESHMTHDAHIFFKSKEDCQAAFKVLDQCVVDEQKLFLIEKYDDEPLKLFYRLQFTDEVTQTAKIKTGQTVLPFFDSFERVVRRTGKHIQEGTLFSNLDLPKRIYNHELAGLVIDYFVADEKRVPLPVESLTSHDISVR